jgi:hypothetical protein
MNALRRADSGRHGPVDSRCPVCGNDLEPGEGVTAEWEGRVLRFRCLGCLARFEADPARYLAGHTDPCGVQDEWDEANRATTFFGAHAAWEAIASGLTPCPRRRR